MRSAQEFLHWLEAGRGARVLRVIAVVAMTVALSFVIAWKQFRGPQTEATLLQADVGRQLASGKGFTTQVNYAQTAAVLNERGVRFRPNEPFPELHHAPLYSLVIAGALRLLPTDTRDGLFRAPSQMMDGFGGDYLLLGINILLFWVALWLTYELGRRLFEPRVGGVAAVAVLVSLSFWQQTLVLNGTPLFMVLSLAAFLLWHRVDTLTESLDASSSHTGDEPRGPEKPMHRGSRWPLAWVAALGAACGLLFLAEYSTGVLVVVAAAYTATRFRGTSRLIAVATLLGGFAVLAGPWIIRNIAHTGSPTALALYNVALKAGDPTAEPATVRATFASEGADISLRKLANKTLTSLQDNLKGRVWSGGAMWFTAFFVAGCLYRFRSKSTNRLRWIFAASLAVLLVSQAAFNSGDSERLVVVWLAPLMIVFGVGFFFVLLGSNPTLAAWPKAVAAVVLVAQALPLVHTVLAPPPAARFQYPPYFPLLLRSVRTELEARDAQEKFGIMADIPAGVAWYAGTRVWAQPPRLRDFHAIALEQPIGELLLTPRTLDRPFFSELNARAIMPGSLPNSANRFGEWGEIYGGLLTGTMPREFPLRVPQKISENLFVLLNPALPPRRGK